MGRANKKGYINAKRLHWPRLTLPRKKFSTYITLLFICGVAAFALFAAPTKADLSDSLVGDWKFDEGTGTTAADSSGAGNDGTLVQSTGTGSPAWVSPGRDGTGSALQFDGSGNPPQNDPPQNTVNVGNGASIDGMGRYILSMWVNFEPGYTDTGVCGAEWTSLIGRTSSGVDWSYMLYINNTTGHLRAHNKQSNGVARSFDGATVVPTGQWVNLAQVADGNNIRTFVNGIEDASLTYDGTTQSLPTANTWIGQDPRGTCAINGTVDDVRIYDSFEAPGGVWGGLGTWQKADDGTTTDGSSWHDSSDNGNTVTQGTAGAQPTFQANGVNFNPALSFDGTTDFMDYASNLGISGTDNFSTFIASQANNYTGNPVVFGYNMAGPSHMQFFNTSGAWLSSVGGENTCLAQTSTTLPAGSAGIGSFVRASGATAVVWLNGGGNPADQNCLTNFDPAVVYRLGNRGTPSTNWFNGLLPEVIVYNRTLTDTERERVESYLAVKYGTTLEHDYIASDSTTTFWDRTANSTYNNDIAGIGRDDAGSLNQKQSKSVNDDSLVTIGHGDIAATNQANTNDFADDLTFLTWGNDDGSTDVVNDIVPVSNTLLKRMQRIWAVQQTGGTVGTQKIQIPRTELPGNAPKMLISNDETFDGTDQQIDLTANGDTYEADITLSDGQFFTFAVDIAAPGGVPNNLQLWLKADEEVFTDRSGTTKGTTPATDGEVTQSWGDQSGVRTNDATDIDASLTGPIYRNNATDNINFNPALDFSGDLIGYTLEDDYIFSTNSGLSMIAVIAPETAGSIKYVYDFGEAAGSIYGLKYSTNAAGLNTPAGSGGVFGNVAHSRGPAPTLLTGIIDFTTEQELFLDGGIAATDPITTSQLTANEINESPIRTAGPGPVTIGSQSKTANQGGRFFDGRIAEVIVYDEDLDTISANTRNKIESYLALKYGVTLDQATPQDYLASDGTTTPWNAAEGGVYNNDIAGIGRGDFGSLNQKQSRSINDDAFVAIGHGDIAATNQANTNDFASDLTFLTWGNDDGSTDVVNDVVPVSGTPLKRMERIWAAQQTGGTVGTQKIQIPQAELSGTSPTLFISNDATFDNTDQQTALTTSGGNYEADITLSDGQFFTFAVDMVDPEVTTDPADTITQTSATLHGTLDLGDFAEADVFFRYRVAGSADPFTETTPQTLNASGAFNAPISGLSVDTEYEFKAVVQWQSVGTQESEGSLLSFVTDPAVPPDAPINLQAVSVGTSQINLSWDAPADEGGSPITGYQIERSPDGVSGWTTIVADTGNTNTTYPDTGLDSNTQYFYRVSAINVAGTSSPSNVASATTDPEPLLITTESLPDTTVGIDYSQTLQAEGGVEPYTWSIVAGALPDGLSLNPTTGEISGQAQTEGTFNFTVQVTDDLGATNQKPLSIKVVIPVVLTTSLPDGGVDDPYSQTLEAAGGTQPYTWSLTAGALPDGLNLDPATGEISGVPTATGTFTFTVQVEDDGGGFDDQELSITITESGLPPCNAAYVDCWVNPVTGTNVRLVLDDACQISDARIVRESDNAVSDPDGFAYPIGLMNFTADCGTPGYTTTVTQYYFDTPDDNYILRKYDPNTNDYFTIEGANIEQTTINGKVTTIATFQITDGGELDMDGQVNGTIVDPVGLALSPDDSLSDTGQNILIPASIAGLLVTVSLVVMRARRAAGSKSPLG